MITTLAGFDAQCVVDRQDENFPVTPMAGVCSGMECFENPIHFLVVTRDFKPRLLCHLDAEKFVIIGMSRVMLLPEAFYVGQAQSVDVALPQSGQNSFDALRLDVGDDKFHGQYSALRVSNHG